MSFLRSTLAPDFIVGFSEMPSFACVKLADFTSINVRHSTFYRQFTAAGLKHAPKVVSVLVVQGSELAVLVHLPIRAEEQR